MPQTVHTFICGRFNVYFSLKWIDFSKRHKPFIFQICFEMTLRVTIDWKIHRECLCVFSTFEFSLFFQIWSSLEEQKYGFVLTRRKKCIFLYSQNMKSINEAWINSHMKVRFLGLWKISFFQNFGKNIHDLYYWENQHFWFSRKFY